jgi:hypothetical protein
MGTCTTAAGRGRKRPIQFAQHLQRALFLGAQHDAVRIQRVGDGAALPQELRIAGHTEVDAFRVTGVRFPNTLAHQRLHQVAAAHRDGGLVYYYAELGIVHSRPDAARGRLQIAQIGFARLQRRRPHRDENHVALGGRRRQFSGKVDAAARRCQLQQLLQAGLVDRHFAPAQFLDLVRIGVHARNMVAEVSQASACHRSYISCSNDRDPHVLTVYPDS